MPKENIKSKRKFKYLFVPSSFKIGILITLLCLFFLIKHYSLPKNSIDIVGQLERVLYDIRFKLRGPKKLSGVVGALTADDKSIEKFGRWPFPRGIYEKAFQNLQNAGVKWIGFDVFFSEPSHRLLEESLPDLEKILISSNYNPKAFENGLAELLESSPGDISLGKSIDNFGNIVQGFFYLENDEQIKGSSYDWFNSFNRLKSSSIDFLDFPNGFSLNNYKDIISYGAITNTPIIAGKSKFENQY